MGYHLAAADTTGYLLLGLAFLFVPILLYLGNLAARWKRIKKDAAALEERMGRGK